MTALASQSSIELDTCLPPDTEEWEVLEFTEEFGQYLSGNGALTSPSIN